ncbi:spore germination protein, partial [Bacillus sp. AF62]
MRYMKLSYKFYAKMDSESSRFIHNKNTPTLTADFTKNIQIIQNEFQKNPYFMTKYTKVLDKEMALLYFQGLSDIEKVQDYILHLTAPDQPIFFDSSSPFELLKQIIIPAEEIKHTSYI